MSDLAFLIISVLFIFGVPTAITFHEEIVSWLKSLRPLPEYEEYEILIMSTTRTRDVGSKCQKCGMNDGLVTWFDGLCVWCSERDGLHKHFKRLKRKSLRLDD